MHKRQRHFARDASIALFSVLITIVNGQSHGPQPYQYSLNGFRSDLIRFPEDQPTPTRFLHDGSGYAGYESPKRDTSEILQRSNKVSLPYLYCRMHRVGYL